MLLLIPRSEERRGETQAVDLLGDGRAGQLAIGGQKIVEGAGQVVHRPGLDPAGPPGDEGDADAAFVELPLAVAERAVRLEELEVVAAHDVDRSVIAREHDDRVLVEAELCDQVEDSPHASVHPRDHRGVRGARLRVGQVALASIVGRVVPEVLILGERVLGDLHGDVGNRERHVEKERSVLVRLDEGERLLFHQVVRELPALPGAVVPFELDLLAIPIEEGRIVIVGVALAVVAEKKIEALPVGVPFGAVAAQAPLPGRGGRVAARLEELGDRDRGVGDRDLSLGLHRLVVAHPGVAVVLPGHEGAARRRADGAPAIEVGKEHPFGGHLVDAGRADFLLAVGAKLAVPQVVGQNENDVRLPTLTGRLRGRRASVTDHERERESKGRSHGNPPDLEHGAPAGRGA